MTALDLNDKMLAYAKRKNETLGTSSLPRSLEFVKGDMSNFNLGKKNDLVLCLLGTFSHLLDNDAASAAMACISQSLRSGGLLLLELAHPGDLFDGTFVIGDCGKDMWEVPLSPPSGSSQSSVEWKLMVEWGAEFDEFDSVTQVVNRTVSVTTFCGEKVVHSLEEVVPQRQYTVQEIKLLGSIHGLELDTEHGLYGEMDLKADLKADDAYRMIAILKKK